MRFKGLADLDSQILHIPQFIVRLFVHTRRATEDQYMNCRKNGYDNKLPISKVMTRQKLLVHDTTLRIQFRCKSLCYQSIFVIHDLDVRDFHAAMLSRAARHARL